MNYYVENSYGKKFAIVGESTYKQLKRNKEQHGYDLFARPMHEDENWDTTIDHESRSGKTYFVLDDQEDMKIFLEYA